MPNPSVKKTAAPLTFKQKAELHAETVLKYIFGLSVKLGQSHEIARNNYNLGIRHLGAGNFGDAVFRFKVVTWLEPQNVQAWYNLATAYLADGKRSMAISSYRKTLSLKPDYVEAAYMLAVARGAKATPEELPKKMPLSLSLTHFEGLAAGYDNEQVNVSQYRGHIQIAEAVRAVAHAGRMDHIVLDLGCGTGLCGTQLRSIATQMIGIDISEAMLLQAAKAVDSSGRKAYDELLKREAGDFLREAHADSFDIVVAGVLFTFIGDVQEIFRHVSRTLKSGGIFAFTTDMMDGAGYRFDPVSGRFKFSKGYLQEMARAHGLTEVKLEETEVYAAYRMWLGVYKK